MSEGRVLLSCCEVPLISGEVVSSPCLAALEIVSDGVDDEWRDVLVFSPGGHTLARCATSCRVQRDAVAMRDIY